MADELRGPICAGASRPECFGHTADPDAYVPRLATERALRALEDALAWEGAAVSLEGGSGLGKTLLLHVLSRRLAGRLESVYLPVPTLSRSELCAMSLGLLGQPDGGDPEERLLAVADSLRLGGGGLLLLIDDAGSLPAGTARGLVSLAAASRCALNVVFAVEDGSAGQLAAATGGRLVRVRLGDPMNVGETGQYVRRRLGRVLGAQAARRVESDAVAEIHRASHGVPRRVHLVVERLLDLAELRSGAYSGAGAEGAERDSTQRR